MINQDNFGNKHDVTVTLGWHGSSRVLRKPQRDYVITRGLYNDISPFSVGRRPTNASLSLAMMPKTVRIYKTTCRRLKILPLRRVIAQFGKSRIVLHDLCMSSLDVKATCRALKVTRHCRV